LTESVQFLYVQMVHICISGIRETRLRWFVHITRKDDCFIQLNELEGQNGINRCYMERQVHESGRGNSSTTRSKKLQNSTELYDTQEADE